MANKILSEETGKCILSQRSKFAVGTPQADHLTMFTRLDSVALGGKHSLVYDM